MKYLRRQRSRWHRGLFESLWIHRRLLFNPKYGSVGMVSMPYFLIIELLGPVVEMMGYIIMLFSIFLGGVYLEFAILLFMLSILYGSILSMSAVLMEEWSVRKFPRPSDIGRLFVYSFTETLWYRPLTVLWRCEGILDVLRKKRGWGEMARKGVSKYQVEILFIPPIHRNHAAHRVFSFLAVAGKERTGPGSTHHR